MALTCARCGTQNPDVNSFCQACGTPLAAVAQMAPMGPPPGTPPPMMGPPPSMPPPSFSPFYAPSAGAPQAPVHRTPWVLIISGVVVLLVVMVGCGTTLAILNARNSNQPSTSGLGLPSPTPAGTPTPIQQASPTPIGGATTASTSAVSVTVPPGWAATKSDPTVTLTNSSGNGSIAVSSGTQSPPMTAQQIRDYLDKALTAQYPDTRICPSTTTTNGSVGGISGIWWQLCFTVTQGGQSFPAAMTIWAAANSTGSIGYGVLLFTLASNMNAFLNEAKPVLASIQWKLK